MELPSTLGGAFGSWSCRRFSALDCSSCCLRFSAVELRSVLGVAFSALELPRRVELPRPWSCLRLLALPRPWRYLDLGVAFGSGVALALEPPCSRPRLLELPRPWSCLRLLALPSALNPWLLELPSALSPGSWSCLRLWRSLRLSAFGLKLPSALGVAFGS